MNPEQKFARLRDEALWNEVRIPRGRTLEPRRSPWYLQFVIPLVAAAVAALLVITGVNGLRDASLVRPAAVAPTSSPAPSAAAPNDWTSPPEIAFAGDCDNVLTVAEVSEMMGTATSGSTQIDIAQSVLPYSAVLAHNGGLECWWTGDSTSSAPDPRLRITIVPLTGIEQFPERPTCDSTCVSFDENGYEVVGESFDFHLVYEDIRTTVGARTTEFQPKPGTWTRRAGDWPTSIDCAELAPGTLMGKEPKPAGPMAFIGYPLAKNHGNARCNFTSDSTSASAFSLDILSGGAWIESKVQRIANVKLNLPGADSAYALTADGMQVLYVFSGQNYFTLRATDNLDAASAAVPGIIETLNALP
jgi:hypothetical protein